MPPDPPSGACFACSLAPPPPNCSLAPPALLIMVPTCEGQATPRFRAIGTSYRCKVQTNIVTYLPNGTQQIHALQRRSLARSRG